MALTIALVLLAIVLIGGLAVREWREREKMAFLRDLYAAHEVLAAQPDFVRMKAEGEWVRLYLADGTEQAVGLPSESLARSLLPWWHPFRLLGGWKSGDDVFFITGGAADDCWGYVVSADDAVCMEGLHVLRREGGRVWYFSTMAE